MKNIFLNAGIDDIKELLKGGNSEFNQEEDNSIFNLINLNTVWIMNINGIVAKFNSFELFEFMTINILCNNQKLDDYIIYNKQVDRSFKGGYLYIYLKKYLPLIKKLADGESFVSILDTLTLNFLETELY